MHRLQNEYKLHNLSLWGSHLFGYKIKAYIRQLYMTDFFSHLLLKCFPRMFLDVFLLKFVKYLLKRNVPAAGNDHCVFVVSAGMQISIECMCFLQTDKSSEPQSGSPVPLLRSPFPFGVKLHKLEASGCQLQPNAVKPPVRRLS